jgi:hypothetical protein
VSLTGVASGDMVTQLWICDSFHAHTWPIIWLIIIASACLLIAG